MKYIIEYIAGCKGDMLTGLLNQETLSIGNLRKVDRESMITLKDISNPARKIEKPSLHAFEEKLKTLTDKFTTSHPLFFLDKSYHNILNQLDINIIKITFEKKHYQTVRIESFFKNLKSRILVLDQELGFTETSNHDFFSIDYKLRRKNIPLTNSNRAEELYRLLTSQSGFADDIIFNSSKHNQNKILWKYHDLYVEPCLTDDLLQHIDFSTYKDVVEKSWLPEEIHAFDEVWKPRDYGYRSF